MLGEIGCSAILVAVVSSVDPVSQSVELLEFNHEESKPATNDDDWIREELQ